MPNLKRYRGHVDVPPPSLEVADFGLLLLYNSIELVDALVSLFKVLVGGSCPLVYHGYEAVGDGVCGVLQVTTLVHTEDSFS